MKNKGFTLVELLAIIILLGLLLTFTYTKILNIADKKEAEIKQSKIDLIENAAIDYMNNDINSYPQTIGAKYCISLEILEDENLIPVDVADIKEDYNFIKIIIGVNSNSYNLVQAEDETSCIG